MLVAMLEKIISGGQSGADQAGWRVARAFGIPTGGAMPLGFLTEEGSRPEFAELYGAGRCCTKAVEDLRSRKGVIASG